MKAKNIIEALFELADKDADFNGTCDTCKAGNPDAEVTKVAVSMFGTVEVVKSAKEWGAELLIVHEPLYYNHYDEHSDDAIECEKRSIIENSGLTIYRFHDHPHYTTPDMISAGELQYFKLPGKAESTDVFDLVRIELETEMTAKEVAAHIENNTGTRHIRICGCADKKCARISLMVGTPGGVFEELKNPESEIVITGEACEWALGEYARDAAQLGHKKALLIMGHVGSERDGMKYTADVLKKMYPELEVKYFENGEVYSYTDDVE